MGCQSNYPAHNWFVLARWRLVYANQMKEKHSLGSPLQNRELMSSHWLTVPSWSLSLSVKPSSFLSLSNILIISHSLSQSTANSLTTSFPFSFFPSISLYLKLSPSLHLILSIPVSVHLTISYTHKNTDIPTPSHTSKHRPHRHTYTYKTYEWMLYGPIHRHGNHLM